jgi:hypothetical protein
MVWVLSLLTYAGEEAEALVIHRIGQSNAEYMRIFDTWGIPIHTVERFDTSHPNSNKLAQLESRALHDADFVVLCDCDIAFCSQVSSWVRGDAIRARIGSYNGFPPGQWERVFHAAGLPLPKTRVKALLNGLETLPSYCNGGLYIVPQNLFQRLREAWPRWDRWLLKRPDLIRPFAVYADQISFAMSCEELGLAVDHLPLEMNCDGVFHRRALRRVTGKDEIQPVVLHYHELDANGLLPLKRIPSINRQINKINDLIRLAEWVNFELSSLLLLRERGTG